MLSRSRTWAPAHAGSLFVLAILAAGCGLNSGGGAGGAAGPPTYVITKVQGDNQTASPATTLPKQLVVLVTDPQNHPLSNVPVSWSIASGGGSLTGTAALTDANGQAFTNMTLGPAPGMNTAVVTIGSALATFTEAASAQGGSGLTMFVSGVPGVVTVGDSDTLVVSVRDSTGAVYAGYRGTVQVTSTDPAASLPANYTFTASDGGTHSFAVSLNTTGSWALTATDVNTPTLTGTESPILVRGGPATHYVVSGIPSPYSQGNLSDVLVVAADAHGNPDYLYTGTVAFSTTDADPGVLLPAAYTFTSTDAGVHRFSLGVRLETPGSQTVTAKDTVNPTITGSETVTVTAVLRVTSFTSASPKVEVKGTDALSWTISGAASAVTLNGTGLGTGKGEPTSSPGSDTPPAPFPGGTPPGPSNVDPRAFYRLTATNSSFTSEVCELTQVAQGGGTTATTSSIAAFPDGSGMAVGSFTGTATFSGTVLSSSSPAAFFVRLNADGTLAWAKQTTGSGTATGQGVAAFPDGTSVVTGTFTGTVTFDATDLTSAGGKDVFLARYKADGTLDWAKSLGGTGDDSGAAVSSFIDGTFALAGSFSSTVSFGSSITLTSAGGTDIFLGHFAPDGTPLWVVQNGGTGDDTARGVATTPDGHVIVAGSTPNASGGLDAVVASYASDGSLAWTSLLSSSSSVTNVASAAVGYQDGSVAVTGSFRGTAKFSGTATSLTSKGGSDVFVARYTGAGALKWAVSAGGSSDDQGAAISLFPDGTLGVVGSFQGAASFGSSSLTSSGGNDAFACRYDGATGSVIWANQAGGSTDDFGLAAAAFEDGSLAVGGSFTGSATFGPGVQLTALGSPDAFVMRLSPVNYGMLLLRPQGFDECLGSSSTTTASYTVSPMGVAAFPDGGYVVTGSYDDYDSTLPVTIGTASLPSTAYGGATTTGSDRTMMFVVRFNADGTVAWASTTAVKIASKAYGYAQGVDVAAFADGTCVVTGTTSSGGATIDFGGGFTTTASGGFFARYSATGACTLLKGPISGLTPTRLAGFPDKSFACVGSFFSSTTVDSVTLTPAGSTANAFTLELDATTKAVWGASGGDSSGTTTYANGVTAFPDGSVGVTGQFFKFIILPPILGGTSSGPLPPVPVGSGGPSTTFGSTTLDDSSAPSGTHDAFFVKYKSDGTLVYAKGTLSGASSSGFSSSDAEGAGIAAASDGTMIATGYLYDLVSFGSTTIGTSATPGIFVVKLGTDGSFSWANGYNTGASGTATATSAAGYSDGSVVITGSYYGTLKLSSTESLTSSGSYNTPFVARFASDGSVTWAKTTVAGYYSYGQAIASFPDQSFVVTGSYETSIVFGDSTEPAKTTLTGTSLYTQELFAAKYFNY